MPNLIGTAPNQVPTNGALGNMAFQNKEAVSVDTLVTTALTVTGTGALTVGGTQIVKDASGNVGIGTTSPSAQVHVSFSPPATVPALGSGVGALALGPAANYGMLLGTISDGSGYIQQQRFDSTSTVYPLALQPNGGNVGIGTSSPGAKLHVLGSEIRLQNTGGFYSFYDTAGTTRVGYIQNATGNIAIVNEQAGYVNFYTSNTERMRINSSGDLLVGTTDVGSSSGTGVKLRPTGYVFAVAPSTTDDTYNYYNTTAGAFRFYVNNAGTIYATSTTISAISDIRLKENVRELDAGLDVILALKPRRFDWKEGKGKDVKDDMGFIAQEVEEVLPALIGDWKAGEGEPDDLKSVKAGDLIPVLVKAIQELTARVAQLEGN